MADNDLDWRAKRKTTASIDRDHQERVVQLNKRSPILLADNLAADLLSLLGFQQAQQPVAGTLPLAATRCSARFLSAGRQDLEAFFIKERLAMGKMMLDLTVDLQVVVAAQGGGHLRIGVESECTMGGWLDAHF